MQGATQFSSWIGLGESLGIHYFFQTTHFFQFSFYFSNLVWHFEIHTFPQGNANEHQSIYIYVFDFFLQVTVTILF